MHPAVSFFSCKSLYKEGEAMLMLAGVTQVWWQKWLLSQPQAWGSFLPFCPQLALARGSYFGHF